MLYEYVLYCVYVYMPIENIVYVYEMHMKKPTELCRLAYSTFGLPQVWTYMHYIYKYTIILILYSQELVGIHLGHHENPNVHYMT